MATLDFKGPFHWDHIYDSKRGKYGDCGKINSLLQLNKPGIYIWGFVMKYDSKRNEFGNFVTFKEQKDIGEYTCDDSNPIGVKLPKDWKFIPYYVGKASSIYGRLSDHRSFNKKKINQRYTRLEINAYKTFFLENNFPILTTNMSRLEKSNLIKKYIFNYSLIQKTSSIEYYNSNLVLDYIYGLNGILNQNNIPNDGITIIPIITKKNTKKGYIEDFDYDKQFDNFQKNYLIQNTSPLNIDSLNMIINKKNNFWFCYAETPKKQNLEYPESQTYYSLKGITISETKGFKELLAVNPSSLYNLTSAPTCSKIFKRDNTNKIISLDKFDGYLKDDPYVI